MAKKRKKFSCDFETTTDPNDCRVWAYGYMEIGNKRNYKIGNSIDEFMIWVSDIQADLYFHNLRFDGEFIVNWLLKNGFTYSDSGQEKTFHCIISGMGQWYMIDICYGYDGREKKHTVIYDSLKKLPFPVKKIAKDFKLPIAKGEIDYHKPRPIGYEITPIEYAYIRIDIEIIADALQIQFNQGLDRMTNGSDSMKGFKDIFSKKLYEKHFPVFSLEMDADIRRAYRGGFTWLNDRFENATVGEGVVFDVNSLYPSVMYNKLLPYGMPIYFKGKYEDDTSYPLYIQHVRCEFELKPDRIPTIQIKKNAMFKQNEYLKTSNGEITDLYVTNVDWEMVQEHYYVHDVEYVSGWKFMGKTGIFNNFIDKWTYIKVNSDGAIKALAKLMLNSLYGKFASNPDVTGKIPFLKENGACGFTKGEEEFKKPIYTAMGVFITSWARHVTIGTAQACYDRIIYCDTDSIHLTGTEIPESIEHVIDDNKLGYWAFEGTYKRGKYIRQKTYLHELYTDDTKTDTYLSVKCAGMPDAVKDKVTFDNFQRGFTANGKLLPMHVNGGVVLKDTQFTLK